MIDPDHPKISVRKQSLLLGVNRNRLAPTKPKVSPEDQHIMNLLDVLHLRDPSAGGRRLRVYLKREHGLSLGRRRVRRLMRLAGIEATWCRPRTSIPGKGHKIYPYLLRNCSIDAPDEVWCSDITYIPMARGFCYLCAVMDWHSRAVLGWAVSTSMDAGLCVEALRHAQLRTGKRPGIMNTDQGSQYTSGEWVEALKAFNPQIQISMDGKGCWMDNVFIERLWRSVKYEDVYLKAYETPRDLARGLNEWFDHYNHRRPHVACGDVPPWECYTRIMQEAA